MRAEHNASTICSPAPSTFGALRSSILFQVPAWGLRQSFADYAVYRTHTSGGSEPWAARLSGASSDVRRWPDGNSHTGRTGSGEV